MSDINITSTLIDLTSASDRYEAALVANDIATLQELFWESPLVIRYGATENLYGSAEIEAFRKQRPSVGLAREIVRREIVTFGTDTGSVNLEFSRNTGLTIQHGRQSQMWRKFPEGWRIVAAHVSLLRLS